MNHILNAAVLGALIAETAAGLMAWGIASELPLTFVVGLCLGSCWAGAALGAIIGAGLQYGRPR